MAGCPLYLRGLDPCPQHWRLKGEGNANWVFAYEGHSPQLAGKVLRVRKPRPVPPPQQAALEDAVWGPLLGPASGADPDAPGVPGLATPSSAGSTPAVTAAAAAAAAMHRQQRYVERVLAPLLGEQHIPGVLPVAVDPAFLTRVLALNGCPPVECSPGSDSDRNGSKCSKAPSAVTLEPNGCSPSPSSDGSAGSKAPGSCAVAAAPVAAEGAAAKAALSVMPSAAMVAAAAAAAEHGAAGAAHDALTAHLLPDVTLMLGDAPSGLERSTRDGGSSSACTLTGGGGGGGSHASKVEVQRQAQQERDEEQAQQAQQQEEEEEEEEEEEGKEEALEGSGPVVCLELKPKCGFVGSCGTVHPANRPLKRHRSRYQLHQLLKLSQGKIATCSSYDPQDLFSGQPSRLRRALHALLEHPQNNLRLFVDGRAQPLHGCGRQHGGQVDRQQRQTEQQTGQPIEQEQEQAEKQRQQSGRQQQVEQQEQEHKQQQEQQLLMQQQQRRNTDQQQQQQEAQEQQQQTEQQQQQQQRHKVPQQVQQQQQRRRQQDPAENGESGRHTPSQGREQKALLLLLQAQEQAQVHRLHQAQRQALQQVQAAPPQPAQRRRQQGQAERQCQHHHQQQHQNHQQNQHQQQPQEACQHTQAAGQQEQQEQQRADQGQALAEGGAFLAGLLPLPAAQQQAALVELLAAALQAEQVLPRLLQAQQRCRYDVEGIHLLYRQLAGAVAAPEAGAGSAQHAGTGWQASSAGAALPPAAMAVAVAAATTTAETIARTTTAGEGHAAAGAAAGAGAGAATVPPSAAPAAAPDPDGGPGAGALLGQLSPVRSGQHGASQAEPGDHAAAVRQLLALPRAQAHAVLRDYVVAATAKDCALMITLQRQADRQLDCQLSPTSLHAACPGTAGERGEDDSSSGRGSSSDAACGANSSSSGDCDGGGGQQQCPSQGAALVRPQRGGAPGVLRLLPCGTTFLYRLAFVDLDLKPLAKIPQHFELDQRILAAARAHEQQQQVQPQQARQHAQAANQHAHEQEQQERQQAWRQQLQAGRNGSGNGSRSDTSSGAKEVQLEQVCVGGRGAPGDHASGHSRG